MLDVIGQVVARVVRAVGFELYVAVVAQSTSSTRWLSLAVTVTVLSLRSMAVVVAVTLGDERPSGDSTMRGSGAVFLAGCASRTDHLDTRLGTPR